VVQVVQQEAARHPREVQLALKVYLSQVPGVARQSLRRLEDRKGLTVSATCAGW